MSLAIERILEPAIGRPARRTGPEANRKLPIAVVFTSVESTLAALKVAGNLANNLGARITLVVPQVVPYPLALETPPVLLAFNENRFRVIAKKSPVETSVQIYLGRDRFKKPGSIVVLGGRKRWWPTKDRLLAGYEVIFKETE
jgi:lipoprotein-anchoring transpeptidase ErfK/SrfK